MSNKDRIEWIYMRTYGFSVLILSGVSLILLLATNFAYWLDPHPIYVRFSSNFRLSLLVLLPLFLGFLTTSTLSSILMFTNIGSKELWNKLIFWVSLGIMAITVIAGVIILIAVSILDVSYRFGAGFIGSLIISLIIALTSFLFFKINQELRS